MHVCPAYFTLPPLTALRPGTRRSDNGTREGTIVHEVSHFLLVADTHDHCYSRSECSEMARQDPARAIENECYVVIAGSVGNLPQVESLDVQYSQSAVLTPSDFSFPHDATLNEATPNTEMLLFSDLDMDKLKILHSEGTVRNLKDRREDLYDVILKKRDV